MKPIFDRKRTMMPCKGGCGKNDWFVFVFVIFAAAMASCTTSEEESMKNDKHASEDVYKGEIGFKAPHFSLPDQNNEPVSLGDFLGKSVMVLYFYPKDNTSVCTAQACSFRDSYETFKEAGAVVVGISSDSVDSHKGFAAQHNLPFHLLSDEGGKVRKQYGATAMPGVPGRVTYVIDKEGVVRHRFSAMFNADKHIEEALKIVKALNES